MIAGDDDGYFNDCDDNNYDDDCDGYDRLS